MRLQEGILHAMAGLASADPLVERFMAQAGVNISILRGDDIPAILSELNAHAKPRTGAEIIAQAKDAVKVLPSDVQKNLQPSVTRLPAATALERVNLLVAMRDVLLQNLTVSSVDTSMAQVSAVAGTLQDIATPNFIEGFHLPANTTDAVSTLAGTAPRKQESTLSSFLSAFTQFMGIGTSAKDSTLLIPVSPDEQAQAQSFILRVQQEAGIYFDTAKPAAFMQTVRDHVPEAFRVSASAPLVEKGRALRGILETSTSFQDMLATVTGLPGNAKLLGEYRELTSHLDHLGDGTDSSPCAQTFDAATSCIRAYLQKLEQTERTQGGWQTFAGNVQDFLWNTFGTTL